MGTLHVHMYNPALWNNLKSWQVLLKPMTFLQQNSKNSFYYYKVEGDEVIGIIGEIKPARNPDKTKNGCKLWLDEYVHYIFLPKIDDGPNPHSMSNFHTHLRFRNRSKLTTDPGRSIAHNGYLG